MGEGHLVFVRIGVTKVHIVSTGQSEDNFTLQLGGGGELVGFQFGGACFQSIHTTAQGSQLSGEFFLQLLQRFQVFLGSQGIGGGCNQLVDAIQASVQTSCEFVTGQSAVTEVATAGVTGDATITLNQGLQRLERPVGGGDVAQLGNGGYLLHCHNATIEVVDRGDRIDLVVIKIDFVGQSSTLGNHQRSTDQSGAHADCIPQNVQHREFFLTPNRT